MANGKDTKMTTKKTNAKKTEATAEWLTATMRNGRRRIETLGWKRLAKMYFAARAGSALRKTIEREARRCGYTPRTILSIHAE